MKNYFTRVVLLFVFFSVEGVFAYNQPYSLNTTGLSVEAEAEHSVWPSADAINGDYSYGNGWWSIEEWSILFKFNDGAKIVDKIQIVSGDLNYNVMEGFQLFYTTDLNPTLASIYYPVTNLVFLNTVSGIITGNSVQMIDPSYEVLAGFDPVAATGIKLLDVDYGYEGLGIFSGGTVYNEITIDEGSLPIVPEPLSIITIMMSLAGLGLRKLTK